MTAHAASSRERLRMKTVNKKNGGIFEKRPGFSREANLSLSRKTVQESLFKILLKPHSFVPKHFLKIDCEVGLLAAKNYAACANRVTFRLLYLCVPCGSREV